MELIVTQWDVNVYNHSKLCKEHYELIVTQWDVNEKLMKNFNGLKCELIVTQWDVNMQNIIGISIADVN